MAKFWYFPCKIQESGWYPHGFYWIFTNGYKILTSVKFVFVFKVKLLHKFHFYAIWYFVLQNICFVGIWFAKCQNVCYSHSFACLSINHCVLLSISPHLLCVWQFWPQFFCVLLSIVHFCMYQMFCWHLLFMPMSALSCSSQFCWH